MGKYWMPYICYSENKKKAEKNWIFSLTYSNILFIHISLLKVTNIGLLCIKG